MRSTYQVLLGFKPGPTSGWYILARSPRADYPHDPEDIYTHTNVIVLISAAYYGNSQLYLNPCTGIGREFGVKLVSSHNLPVIRMEKS